MTTHTCPQSNSTRNKQMPTFKTKEQRYIQHSWHTCKQGQAVVSIMNFVTESKTPGDTNFVM
jgi:hypothetical protein